MTFKLKTARSVAFLVTILYILGAVSIILVVQSHMAPQARQFAIERAVYFCIQVAIIVFAGVYIVFKIQAEFPRWISTPSAVLTIVTMYFYLWGDVGISHVLTYLFFVSRLVQSMFAMKSNGKNIVSVILYALALTAFLMMTDSAFLLYLGIEAHPYYPI